MNASLIGGNNECRSSLAGGIHYVVIRMPKFDRVLSARPGRKIAKLMARREAQNLKEIFSRTGEQAKSVSGQESTMRTSNVRMSLTG